MNIDPHRRKNEEEEGRDLGVFKSLHNKGAPVSVQYSERNGFSFIVLVFHHIVLSASGIFSALYHYFTAAFAPVKSFDLYYAFTDILRAYRVKVFSVHLFVKVFKATFRLSAVCAAAPAVAAVPIIAAVVTVYSLDYTVHIGK